MANLIKCVALTAVLGYSLMPAAIALFWGDWGKATYCPQGERAIGFKLKTEGPQGSGDDTALNGIALKCSGGQWISSTVGIWGNWGNEFICPGGTHLTSCQLRIEPKQGAGDDTSANNLNCKCSSGVTLNGDGTSWGDWKKWSNPCTNGIMALHTRVERAQGEGDDTALNDVSFTCKQKA